MNDLSVISKSGHALWFYINLIFRFYIYFKELISVYRTYIFSMDGRVVSDSWLTFGCILCLDWSSFSWHESFFIGLVLCVRDFMRNLQRMQILFRPLKWIKHIWSPDLQFFQCLFNFHFEKSDIWDTVLGWLKTSFNWRCREVSFFIQLFIPFDNSELIKKI